MNWFHHDKIVQETADLIHFWTILVVDVMLFDIFVWCHGIITLHILESDKLTLRDTNNTL